MVFYDLRSNKLISIVNNLYSDKIGQVSVNQSGKSILLFYLVLVMYDQIVDVVDVYKKFAVTGNFSQLTNEIVQKMYPDDGKIKVNKRKLTDMLIINKYIVLGCDNGCI